MKPVSGAQPLGRRPPRRGRPPGLSALLGRAVAKAAGLPNATPGPVRLLVQVLEAYHGRVPLQRPALGAHKANASSASAPRAQQSASGRRRVMAGLSG